MILAVLAMPVAADSVANMPHDPTPEGWPWGFGKNGMPAEPDSYDHTLYVDDVAENGDGSAARPFKDLRNALKEAGELMKSMEMRRDTRIKDIALPAWVRLVREGDQFSMYVAEDQNGQPGTWRQAGDGRSVDMPENYHAGLLVYPDHGWPTEPTVARIDSLSLNGKPIDGWRNTRFARGRGSHEVADGVLTLQATRGARMNKDDWDDEGYYVFVPVSGDAEMVARITSLSPSAKHGKGAIGLMMRENPHQNGRMAMLEIFGEGENNSGYEVSEFYRWHRDTPGGSVKIIVREGVHYAGDAWESAELPVRDDIADDLFLCIEGEGRAVYSGAEPAAAWSRSTWKLEQDNTFSRAWDGGERGDPVKRPNDAIVALTPAGGSAEARVHLTPVDQSKWSSEPGTFTLKGDRILMALPEDWSASDFTDDVLVEVSNRDMRGFYSNALPGMTPNRGPGNNVILRNLVIEHFADPVRINGYSGPFILNRNWLLEDVAFQYNNKSADFRFIRDYTFRRVSAIHSLNKGGIGTITAEGQFVDCDFSHNGGNGWTVADKNVLIYNTRIVGNRSHGIRMDHLAENLVYNEVTIADNRGQGGVYETAGGPVMYLNSTISNNLNGNTSHHNDGQFSLAMANNFTFDGCTFTYSSDAALALYPRARAHWPKDSQYDQPGTLALPPNSMDYMQWSRLRERGADPELLSQPNGEKPASFDLNIIVRNCTFNATGKDTLFYGEHYFDRDEGFDRAVKRELMAYNNEYNNPDNPTPFALAAEPGWNQGQEVLGNWSQWKANGNPTAMYWDPNYRFEAGSAFNSPAPRDFTPAKRPLATSGDSPDGVREGSVIRYEAEVLPFVSNGEVERREDAQASGGVYHKLLANQMGDYGQYVEYTLNVPEDGEYYVTVEYLRNSGPFEYLGFAQLTVNAEDFFDWWPNNIETEYNPFSPEHMYWDQSGLTREFTSVPLGRMHLTAGEHRFRFDPAWKDGWVSPDYDITIDAITLSRELNPMLARAVTGDTPGLRWEYYELDPGVWFTQLPDFDALKAKLSGVFGKVGLMAADEHFGYRYTGYIEVPETDIYTFTLAVHGQANLYIGGKRVIDCDGPHGFWDEEAESAEPWFKYGRVALEKGKHPFRLDFRNKDGHENLKLLWEAEGGVREEVPESAFTNGGQAR